MKTRLLKTASIAALGLALSACANNFPRYSELPSYGRGGMEGQMVLLKVSFEASEDASHACASELIARQAPRFGFDNVVRTDRPLASRSVSFSKTLVFRAEHLDPLFVALSHCRQADGTGVRWATLRWTVDKVNVPTPAIEPYVLPAYKEPGMVGS